MSPIKLMNVITKLLIKPIYFILMIDPKAEDKLWYAGFKYAEKHLDPRTRQLYTNTKYRLYDVAALSKKITGQEAYGQGIEDYLRNYKYRCFKNGPSFYRLKEVN
ncbi:MAG: hypothetical protein OQL19_10230 [Gammaproteobacteria bacterium]|nr:hypothetical protein [Gammaproteobacteria bacterium]